MINICKIDYDDKEKFEAEVIRRIDSKESFGEDELSELLWRLEEVDRKQYDDDRWTRPISSILRIGERFFQLNWDKGLTEYQEDYFDEQPFEVFCKEKVVVERDWVPVERGDN
jgi:hypothetical protein